MAALAITRMATRPARAAASGPMSEKLRPRVVATGAAAGSTTGGMQPWTGAGWPLAVVVAAAAVVVAVVAAALAPATPHSAAREESEAR